MKITNIN